MSISVKRMKKLLKDDYQIIDIRSAAEIAHGEIPGAVIVAPENVLDNKNIDYSKIHGLRTEAKQKLNEIKPRSMAQASRISGVSPADMAALMIYLENNK